MKRNKLLTIMLALFGISSFAQSYQWSTKIESNGDDQGNGITLDDSENVYSTGLFSNTVDFDPGKDSLKITSMGMADVFIQKLNKDGGLIWAKQIGGKGSDIGINIEVDKDGNVYIAGTFNDSVDFDPDLGTEVHVPNGEDDVFIQKLDKDGNFIWVKTIGGENNESVGDLSIDQDGNILFTGNFLDTISIETESGSKELISKGEDDFFITKLNQNGDISWVNHIGGKGKDQTAGIVGDAKGNLFVTGIFMDTVDFDSGDGTEILISESDTVFDIFIQKLDPDGNHIWTKKIGGSAEDVVRGIELNKNNLYLTGYFTNNVDFDPSEEVAELSSAGFVDIFILKLDLDGKYVWAKSIGGFGPEIGLSISIDASENVYTTGAFYDKVDFDPGTGTEELTALDFDPFILKLDSDGNYLWAKRIGGAVADIGWAIVASEEGIVYTTGYVNGDVDFDPGPRENVVVGMGGTDMFILKLGFCDETESSIEATGCNKFISPSGKIWAESDTYVDTIFNVGGCDSIITIDLTINEIDTSVSYDEDKIELVSNAKDVTYQWLDCNNDYAEIEGETDATFSFSTGGKYAVKLTTEECSDTSSCFSVIIDGIEEQNFQNSIHLYPNPTNEKVNISFTKTYQSVDIIVTDVVGKVVIQQKKKSLNKIILNFDNQPDGIYFLQLNTEREQATLKIIKD